MPAENSSKKPPHRAKPAPAALTIRRAAFPADLAIVSELFREYVASLPFVLDFQGFERELAELPGCYAEPQGCVLVATGGLWAVAACGSQADDSRSGPPPGVAASVTNGSHEVTTPNPALGCVALRPLEPGICEMKRMYVRADARGLGVGRALGEAILREAAERGYNLMRLDTIARMTAANALYASLGFRPTAPYCFNPLPDALFFEHSLP